MGEYKEKREGRRGGGERQCESESVRASAKERADERSRATDNNLRDYKQPNLNFCAPVFLWVFVLDLESISLNMFVQCLYVCGCIWYPAWYDFMHIHALLSVRVCEWASACEREKRGESRETDRRGGGWMGGFREKNERERNSEKEKETKRKTDVTPDW